MITRESIQRYWFESVAASRARTSGLAPRGGLQSVRTFTQIPHYRLVRSQHWAQDYPAKVFVGAILTGHPRARSRGEPGLCEATRGRSNQGQSSQHGRFALIPKLTVRVRFSSPAPLRNRRSRGQFESGSWTDAVQTEAAGPYAGHNPSPRPTVSPCDRSPISAASDMLPPTAQLLRRRWEAHLR
jgi:hypothetical protein